jgi:cbb3-type cytochrome oxidase maturation protein
MEAMIYLIPITLVMGVASFAVFLWSLRTRQYDDPQGAAWRILGDDSLPGGAGEKQP